MKYFSHELSYEEIKEQQDCLNDALDAIFEVDHKIDYWNTVCPKTGSEFIAEAKAKIPEIVEIYQDTIFLLLDIDYLVNRIPYELLEMINKKHPEWINKMAEENLSAEE